MNVFLHPNFLLWVSCNLQKSPHICHTHESDGEAAMTSAAEFSSECACSISTWVRSTASLGGRFDEHSDRLFLWLSLTSPAWWLQVFRLVCKNKFHSLSPLLHGYLSSQSEACCEVLAPAAWRRSRGGEGKRVHSRTSPTPDLPDSTVVTAVHLNDILQQGDKLSFYKVYFLSVPLFLLFCWFILDFCLWILSSKSIGLLK